MTTQRIRTGIKTVMGLAIVSGWLPGSAMAVSSCSTPDTNVTITTCYYDLTGSPSSTQAPASAVLNGGVFRVPAENGDLGKGTIVGTGVLQPFLRIQETANGSTLKSNGIEAGFNTDASVKNLLDDHDKGGSNWNHSIQLKDVPAITVCDGGGTTGTNCQSYLEFILDTNEQGNSINSGLSLDEFKLFWAGAGDLSAYSGADDTKGITGFAITGGTLAYDMDAGPGGDASLLMDYQNFSGSGNGVDLQALVPLANFAGVSGDSYLYLYSKFGATGDTCLNPTKTTGRTTSITGDSPCMTPDGTNSTGKTVSSQGSPTKAGDLNMYADAGFEEWSVRKNTVDLPPTLSLFALGLLSLAGFRSGRRGSNSVLRTQLSGPIS